MPKLPSVSSDIPRDLRQYLDRVREIVDGAGLDELVTMRKIVAAGIGQYSGGTLTQSEDATYYATPPAPTGLTTSGALASVALTWDQPAYPGHAYAEIWAAQQTPEQAAATPEEFPVIGDAVLVGMAPGGVWSHSIGHSASRWYWVRFINVEGQAGPYNTTDGVKGTTGADPAYLLETLSGAITSSQLFSDLGGRIDLIDGDATVPGSVNARLATLQTQINSLVSVDAWSSADAYTVGQQVTYNGRLYTALLGSTNVQPGTDPATWEDLGDFSNIADAVAALTVDVSANADAVTGLEGKFVVKTDLNGYVSGFGFASTSNGATPSSEFVIRADSFAVGEPSDTAFPAGSEPTPEVPFAVYATGTTINGEVAPAGTYIKDAFIRNGTITRAKIGNAAIDDAKVANLDAAKITTGYLAAARLAAGSVDASKIDSRELSIKDADGNVILSASANLPIGRISGLGDFAALDQINAGNISTYLATAAISTAYIADGAVGNAKIGNIIQSANYQSGVSGWQIRKDGGMEMNDATFRGTLDITGTVNQNRLEITGDTLKVIDSNNVVRVKIGDLSQ